VESLSSIEIETSKWGNSGDQIVKKFISATTLTLQSQVPSGNDSTSIEKICEILIKSLLIFRKFLLTQILNGLLVTI
jgi:hypothetical protein